MDFLVSLALWSLVGRDVVLRFAGTTGMVLGDTSGETIRVHRRSELKRSMNSGVAMRASSMEGDGDALGLSH